MAKSGNVAGRSSGSASKGASMPKPSEFDNVPVEGQNSAQAKGDGLKKAMIGQASEVGLC